MFLPEQDLMPVVRRNILDNATAIDLLFRLCDNGIFTELTSQANENNQNSTYRIDICIVHENLDHIC